MPQPNYSVLDPIALGPKLVIQESGLVLTSDYPALDINRVCRGTQGKTAGKWMFEVGYWGDDVATGLVEAGICTNSASLSTALSSGGHGYGYRIPAGGVYNGNTLVGACEGAAAKIFIGVVVNFDTSQMSIWKNGSQLVTFAITPATGGRIYYPAFSLGSQTAAEADHIGLALYVNFGQRAFAYPLPGATGWFSVPPAVAPKYIGPVGDNAYASAATDTPANQIYLPGLVNGGADIQIDKAGTVWPWVDASGAAESNSATYSTIQIDDSFGDFTDLITNADAYRDAPVYLRMLTDENDTLQNVANTIATCLIDTITRSQSSESVIQITLKDKLESDKIALQRRIFAPWCDPGVAGLPYPIVVGAARSVDVGAFLVDSPNRIFQLGDANCYIGVLRDKGNPLDASQYALTNDLAAVIPDNLPEGKFTADVGGLGTNNQYPAQPDALGGVGSDWDTTWQPPPSPFAPPPGWVITNTDTFSQGYTSQAFQQGHVNGLLHEQIHLESRRPLSAIGVGPGAGTEFSFHLDTLRPLIAGKTYTISFVMYNYQDGGAGTYGGLCVMSAQTSQYLDRDWISPARMPLVGAAFDEVPFSLVYTVPAGAPRNIYFTVVGDSGQLCSCQIYNIVIKEQTGVVVDIPLIGSGVTNYMTQMYTRGKIDPAEWSSADTDALDAIYAGAPFGAQITDPGATLASGVNLLLTSICSVVQVDKDGIRRFRRLVDPALATPLATYTEADIDYPVAISQDYAEGLTQTVGSQRNWTLYSDSDFVSDDDLVPAALRTQLKRNSRIQQVCNLPLNNSYQFAQQAAAFDSIFDNSAVALAEMTRVLRPYSTTRPYVQPITGSRQSGVPPQFVTFTINYRGVPPEYLFGDVVRIDYTSPITVKNSLRVLQNVAVTRTTLMPGKQKLTIYGWG